MRMSERACLAALGAVLLRGPVALASDEWLGRDKVLHLAAGGALAAVGYQTAALWTTEPVVRAGSGVMLAMGAGLAKEMYDRTSGGDPSLRDVAWDAVGAATGILVTWLIHRFTLSR